MRKLLTIGALIAAIALPTASRAGGFTLGLRLGYGASMGDAYKGWGMSDYVGSQVPFQVDAMYRINPQLALGGYFSYGFAQPSGVGKDVCDSPGASCSISNLRVGVQGIYAFTQASPKFVPWAGVGIGYEASSFDSGFGGGASDTTGWEYVNLQGGLNFKLSPLFGLGPYVMYSIGQYGNIEGTSIPEKGMHEWLSFGVMGKFDFSAK